MENGEAEPENEGRLSTSCQHFVRKGVIVSEIAKGTQ